MALRNARISANPIPAQMSLATDAPLGAVAAAWSWNVIHRNAPGAMSAMAFTVAPVRPSDGFTPGACGVAGVVTDEPPLWALSNVHQFVHIMHKSTYTRQLPVRVGMQNEPVFVPFLRILLDSTLWRCRLK